MLRILMIGALVLGLGLGEASAQGPFWVDRGPVYWWGGPWGSVSHHWGGHWSAGDDWDDEVHEAVLVILLAAILQNQQCDCGDPGPAPEVIPAPVPMVTGDAERAAELREIRRLLEIIARNLENS